MRGYLTEPEVLERWTRDVCAALGEDLVRISLFGSRARGDADPASDFDVLVVVSRRDPVLKRPVYALSGDYLADHRVDVSAKVLPQREYERLATSGLPFWRRLAREEVVLWPRSS